MLYGPHSRNSTAEIIEKYFDSAPLKSDAKVDYGALLPFAIPKEEQVHVSESYVSVPPALIITDERNDVWTLGFMTAPRSKTPEGEFAFDVLRNGKWCGEVASRIEKRSGRVRIFTADGWKNWNAKFNSFF